MGYDGQSMIEFLLVLPVLIGLVGLLTRAMSAVQMSIVSQKYARAQTLYLAANSPVYPALRHRQGANDAFTSASTMANEMVLGVEEKVGEDEEARAPIVQQQAIARPGRDNRANDEGEDPRRRSRIRIYNTVTLCTQNNVVLAGSQPAPSGEFTGIPDGALSENSRFDFCRGLPQ